jgi:chromosome partitioning protein
MKIISVVNQKGGCGKTTLAVNLAAALARMGNETLIIDLDPQAHATFAMGYTRKALEMRTSYDIFRSYIDGEPINFQELIINDRQNISFIPANMMLSAAEINLGGVNGAAAILSRMLTEPTFEKFEYIIIDSPPSFGFLTLNSMYASHMVIVPLDMSYFSFNGVSNVYRVTGLLSRETGKELSVYFAMNIYDARSNFARTLDEEAKAKLGKYFFNTKIRSSVRIREASRNGQTIFEHDPKCTAALDYYNLTSEVVNLDKIDIDMVIKEFMLHAPKAGSVYVLGDFNGWKKSEVNQLTKLDNGTWSAHFTLPKGKFRYKYLIDDQWMNDPNNPQSETNVFGSIDSIIQV